MDARNDFRGGRNSSVLPDNLNPTELVDATNARVLLFGGLIKRTGTRRVNIAALAGSVNGVTQWDAPSGKQTVAIAGGNLYYRAQGFGDFTTVASTFPNANAHFATFRANTSGAPLKMYIACGGKVFSWDGAGTLTEIDGVNTVPPATLVVPYHTRLFMNHQLFPQFVAWSGVGDPANFTPSTAVAGGTAMVDVMRGDSIVAMEAIMSSLIIATKESVARFTGYSANDIQIAQDTQGVSAELGVVGDNALLRVEQVAMAMTTKGPYAMMEAGVTPIGPWVEPDFDTMDRTQLANVTIGYHQGRREVWFAYAAVGDGGLNKHVLVYNIRLQRWYGPFVYPFGITSFTTYEDATGTKYLYSGATDGFVRHMDIGGLDDVLSGGTGGSNYTMTVELAPYFFIDGPGYQKTLRNAFIQANLQVGHALTISYAFDAGSFTNHLITDVGNPAATLNYRARLTGTGRRVRIQFTDNSSTIPEIAGLMLEAYQRDRP